MCMDCQRLIKAIDNYIRKVDDDLEDIFEEEGRADPGYTIDRMLTLEDEIAAALLAETEYFIKEIKKRQTLSELWNDLDAIKQKDIYCDAIKTAVSEQLHDLVPRLVRKYVSFSDPEIRITAISQRAYAWIDSWSGQLANLMKLTSNKQIEDILKRGLDTGSDISSVTLEIMQSGIRDEYYRARRVAVTEILRAHNVAKQEAQLQNPCVKQKLWRHTGAWKNEPRENHVAIDGQVVDVDKPFTLVGADGVTYYPMFPVDPELPPGEAINCHCIAEDIVDEEILAMPLEERQQLQQQIIDEMDDEWEKELDARNRAKAGIEG